MANITIDEIYSTGRDLFQDAEIFLNELTHQATLGDVETPGSNEVSQG